MCGTLCLLHGNEASACIVILVDMIGQGDYRNITPNSLTFQEKFVRVENGLARRLVRAQRVLRIVAIIADPDLVRVEGRVTYPLVVKTLLALNKNHLCEVVGVAKVKREMTRRIDFVNAFCIAVGLGGFSF